MSFSDLLKMSLSSLWRRKLRTVLTVLGVVVGTASIMVMISLGLGLQANSNAEWMEQVQQSSRSIQATLGGIGAVSLFVAAIGIANTMMMSIYERTKEIGVMKVLGCDMSAIRNMFLAEAGFIGLIGGIVGIMLSYIISAIINFVMRTSYSGISYIPPYLTLLALVFAVVIGMLAGLFPALRAMRLSPLAAIRNE